MEDADSQKDSNPENGSEPEPGADESSENAQKQGDSASRRIGEMKHPYHGPEENGGISAHGIEGETDLRRAKQYAEMVVDTVREGLLVLNFDLRIEAANESFYRMFEVTPDETEDCLIYELGNGQWDIPELRELLEKILPEHKVMTGFEVAHDFENAGRRIMRLNARQLNHHQRILLAIEDITEGEETEERLRASEKKLRELNRSLEKRVQKRTVELRKQTKRLRHLAAELASAEQRERKRLASLLHDDLQQLLYGAEMQLSMARGKVDTDAARAAIEKASDQIGEAVETARNLTSQLRPPALYESGLSPAFEWLASDMADRHDLKVTVDTNKGEIGTFEHSFRDDIKALLYESARELLFNVVKYAGVDEAHLGLFVDTSSSDPHQDKGGGDHLRLMVEDEGRGFDADNMFSGDNQEEGFGLLSIRERIAALGGSMEIDARPGEGTRVEVTLPLTTTLSDEPPQRTAPDEDLEEGPLKESQADMTPHPAQVQVVVADDHAVVRQGITNLLIEDERTTVVSEASNGHEAVEVVERKQPDVVLMDVNMPEMNGVEATREIHDHWPETDVIGLSVQTDRATERSMLDAGADAFAPKSGDVDQIIDTILRVTERSFQSDE